MDYFKYVIVQQTFFYPRVCLNAKHEKNADNLTHINCCSKFPDVHTIVQICLRKTQHLLNNA